MSTTTARLSQLEAAVDRLVSVRGPRVSDLLRQARQRAMACEAPSPVLHTIGELEAMAGQSGIAGRMARGRLRAIPGLPPDALLPVRPTPQDARGGVEGHSDAPGEPRRSTGAEPGTVAGQSVIERIDQLLAVHARA